MDTFGGGGDQVYIPPGPIQCLLSALGSPPLCDPEAGESNLIAGIKTAFLAPYSLNRRLWSKSAKKKQQTTSIQCEGKLCQYGCPIQCLLSALGSPPLCYPEAGESNLIAGRWNEEVGGTLFGTFLRDNMRVSARKLRQTPLCHKINNVHNFVSISTQWPAFGAQT